MTGDWRNIETVAYGETQGLNRTAESVAAGVAETCTAPLLQLTGQ